MGNTRAGFITRGFLLLGLVWAGCMNAPLPPENATLSAQFLLAESDSEEGIEIILPGTAYRGYTDREGRVRFDNLPPREYELLAEAKGYQPYRETKIVLKPGDHVFLGEIALTPQKSDGEIYGTVKVEGEDSATIQVLLLGSNQTVSSASDGKYHFPNVPVGKYQVSFYHPTAIAGKPIDVTIEAGVQTALSEVILKKPVESGTVTTGAIKGKVSIEGNADFSGVTVFISEAGKFVESEEDGTYWVEQVPVGAHDLVFELEGYRPHKIAGVQVASGTITQVTDVILHRAPPSENSKAALRVEKSPDQPIDPQEPGILAGFAFYPDRADHSGILVRVLDPPLESITDPKGAFLIEGVPPGLRNVRAEAPGYQVASLMGVDVAPGTVARLPQLQLGYGIPPIPAYSSARLYGQVLDPDRKPLAGVSVALERTSLSAITGRDGTFLLDQVPIGEFSILFSVEGFHESSTFVTVDAFEDVPIPVVTLSPVMEYLKVISSSPRNGERGVVVSDRVHIEIQFSENLSKNSVGRNIQIQPKVASRIELVQPDTVAIDLPRRKVDGVLFNTDYRVILALGLESSQKHRLETPYELRFTTGGPRVLGSIPASGEKGVLLAIDEPVVLQFNTPVDVKDLKKITVRPNTGEIYNFVPQHVPYGYRVEMQMQLEPNRNYQINIPSTVQTQDGQRFENTPYRIKFESGSYDDLTDPEMTEEFLGESGDPFGP